METDSRERRGVTSAEENELDGDEDVSEVAYEAPRDDLASVNQGILGQPWLILSFLLIVAAAALILLSHTDSAFVAIALGISAWFWNMRMRLKRRYGKQSRWR